ncbi:uncharacterized protein L969DRAFT_26474 [Mixia osmundae IAM 14324]|uniref:sn-1-specific diacylglycerol lipase n=1 Tax=Mixia osmundae (strain CBS 9802 / IAM 14324 / JCM 22182 / KY 12970) TaxID=764103 RepID=G7E1S7_MIXOS|nr:uncharacterized protein L969DRAFT_26474 [Mixia osmundae IAM 14324]KEI36736.1 hypothetical protein L969DRAFT_26474 [Mixia osmundae IAM 14324]GAA96787.1 hypothetical protein E5Q_03458 [Mixia osmundae IAM 14324]
MSSNAPIQADSVEEPGQAGELITRRRTSDASTVEPEYLQSLRESRTGAMTVSDKQQMAIHGSRAALEASKVATTVGFQIAKSSTRFGFNVARSILHFGAGLTGALIDSGLGLDASSDGTAQDVGGGPTGRFLKTALGATLNAAEFVSLAGIELGSAITSTSLNVANSSVMALEATYGSEAIRALGAFVKLVQREWHAELPYDPPGGLSQYSVFEVARAATCWALLQSVTTELYGKRIRPEIEEVDVRHWRGDDRPENQGEENAEVLFDFTVTGEEVMEGERGEIIDAVISHPRPGLATPTQVPRNTSFGGESAQSNDVFHSFENSARTSRAPSPPAVPSASNVSETTTRDHLRRYSKLCLGSYGGLGALFLGVPLPDKYRQRAKEAEATRETSEQAASTSNLTRARLDEMSRRFEEQDMARDARMMNDEAEGRYTASTASDVQDTETVRQEAEDAMTFMSLFNGTHDVELLSRHGQFDKAYIHEPDEDGDSDSLADIEIEEPEGQTMEPTSTLQTSFIPSGQAPGHRQRKSTTPRRKGRRPPRYFVITDHPTKSICLSLRGTLTIDDLATDLTCEEASFTAHTRHWASSESLDGPTIRNSEDQYLVHGGMLEIAEAIGGPSGRLTRAVRRALQANPDYSLFIVGHSLGGGIATLLALLWTDPDTCLTTREGGLPEGRTVKTYAFATPCVTSADLGKRCKKLVHSIVYSYDLVPRLSLGHIRDIRTAAAWLIYAGRENAQEGPSSIISRVLAYRNGRLDDSLEIKMDEETWFVSLRSTLEANMRSAVLFPPGEVYWLVKGSDLDLPGEKDKVQPAHRLFKITGKQEVVFSQIEHRSNMLSAHLPQQYSTGIDAFI